MKDYYDYIIIGSGIAGIKAAESIRLYDHSGNILIINGEDRLPYKRTSISKKLSVGFQMNELALKPVEWFVQNSIDLVTGNVDEILPSSKEILIQNKKIQWKKLILCTGSEPAKLDSSFAQFPGLFYFRNAADADYIRLQNIENEHIVIVGGGVQGIELVEQMLLLGNKVTLIHHEKMLMNRHFDEFMSDQLLEKLKQSGIQVYLHAKIKSIQNSEDHSFRIVFDDENAINCHKIIVSIGTKPNIDLARKAGIKTNKGILVDSELKTSHPDIFAAGDVAEHENGLITGLWHAAEKQGMISGANATGQQLSFEKTIFRLKLNSFDQYYFSMNPQIANADYESLVVKKDEKYYRFFFKSDSLAGLLMMNDKDNAKIMEDAVRNTVSKTEMLSKLT